jgi:hypothetical protein
MSKDMKFRVNGAQDLEIEWPDGRKLAVLPYGKGVDGLADELTDGGTFMRPGGSETITRFGHLVVHLYVPGRAFASDDVGEDRTTLAHWLDEEERLNNERVARLVQWRRALRKKRGQPQE